METKNVTIEQMEQALKDVNQKYDDNVTFNRYPEKTGKRFKFTLRVIDSSSKGARRGHSGRKMTSACWHVHGHYFEALLAINEDAVIKSGNTIIIDKNGGNWQDRNIGSIVDPLYFSEACKC